MPRPGRNWIPIDVDFWDHPAVEAAGEAAACLYQRLLTHAYRHYRDGWIPIRQCRAWYDDWQPRLDALLAVGLVAVVADRIEVSDWSKWHEPFTEQWAREERHRAKDRERKRRKRGSALSTSEQELDTHTHIDLDIESADSPGRNPHRTSGQNGQSGPVPLGAVIGELVTEWEAHSR